MNSSKKLIQIRQPEPVMQLSWIINNICTNRCDYCPASLNSGTNHHYDWEKAKSFVERLLKRYKKIHCSISGGEPTLSPFFPELVRLFYDAGHTVGITSNGVRSNRYIEEISEYLSYIVFSWHPQYDDPNFIEKVLIASKNCNASIRIMMHSDYWDKAVAMYNKCFLYPNFSVEPVKILPELAGRDQNIGNNYTTEQLEWFKENDGKWGILYEHKNNPKWRPALIGANFYYDNGDVDSFGDSNYLASTGQNDFRGWACNIGIESLFIFADGWVKKGNCMQGGQLFHINDHESYPLPTTAEICSQHICPCGTDILISKVPVMDPQHKIIQDNLDKPLSIFDNTQRLSITKQKLINLVEPSK